MAPNRKTPFQLATPILDDAIESGEVKLFFDQDKIPFATIDLGNWQLEGEKLYEWIALRLLDKHKQILRGASTRRDLKHLAYLKLCKMPVRHQTHVYSAVGQDGAHYIDLYRPDFKVARIDVSATEKHPWTIVDPPKDLRFIRPEDVCHPLPTPKRGGDLGTLRKLIAFADDESYALGVMWLLSAMHPKGPYLAATLVEDHSSGKTSAEMVVRSFLDPSRDWQNSDPQEAGMPKTEADFFSVIKGARLLPAGNMSDISKEQSDIACRVLTGGSLRKRKLYSDGSKYVINANVAAFLNGVVEFVEAPDLMSRTVHLRLDGWKGRKQLGPKEFHALRMRLTEATFGALLDAYAEAVRLAPAVDIKPSRYSDAYSLGVAIEARMGVPAGTVMKALHAAYLDRVHEMLSVDLVATGLREIANGQKDDCQRHTYAAVLKHFGDPIPEGVPNTPRRLRGAIMRVRKDLLAVGVRVSIVAGTGNQKFVEIERAADQGSFGSY